MQQGRAVWAWLVAGSSTGQATQEDAHASKQFSRQPAETLRGASHR